MLHKHMKEGTQLELERVGTFRGHILCNNGKLYSYAWCSTLLLILVQVCKSLTSVSKLASSS